MTITARPHNTEGFFFALLGAPLVTSVVVGIPLLVIFPVGLVILFAPFFGYFCFVLVGGPLLWLSVRFFRNNPFTHLAAALIAVRLLGPLTDLGIPLVSDAQQITFGYFVAPLWALAFGILFGKLADEPMLEHAWLTAPEDK